MSQHYVITISRQFASKGRAIARKTAEKLGIYFMDRDIVEETARRMGLPVSEIGNREEMSQGNRLYYQKFPLGFGKTSLEDEIFEVQSNIIRDTVEKQDCIIVGRLAEYVLRDKQRRLSFYVQAPYDVRFHNCTEILGMSDSTAMKMIHDVDLARERYRTRYCENIENAYTYRNIILDSSVFDVDEASDMIATLAKQKFGL